MSEHKPTGASSGMPPGTRKPTVLGERVVAPHKPTTIGTPVTTPLTKPAASSRPTVIPQGEPRAQGKQVETPKVENPSVIPGTVRKPLSISFADLTNFFPGALNEILVKAERVIEGVIVETLRAQQCAQWGFATQQRYGTVVNRVTEVADHPKVRESERHLASLYTLLEKVSNAFSGQTSRGWGIFGKDEEDPGQVFDGVKQELAQLQQLLTVLLPELLEVGSLFDAIDAESKALEEDLEAQALAAEYIAHILGREKPGSQNENLLLERKASLLLTKAELQRSAVLRVTVAESIQKLALRVQDGVMRTLPTWVESVSHWRRNKVQTATDTFMLRQGLEQLLNQLK